MVANGNSRQNRPYAIFDLDGTLINCDSLIPFLTTFGMRQRRYLPVVSLPFYLLLYVFRVTSAKGLKEKLLYSFLQNHTVKTIQQHADWFCETWVPNKQRPDTVRRLRDHQKSGLRVILVSASPSVYVPKIAKFFGIEEVVCTQAEIEGDR